MTQIDQEELEDLDLDQEDNEDGETLEEKLARLQEENEQLKKSKQKLLAKKHKAIQKKTTSNDDGDLEERFEQLYQKRKERERFESENPGIEYDIASAIAEKKGVEIQEAVYYLKSGGSYRIGQDNIPDPKQKDTARKERLAKMIGLG